MTYESWRKLTGEAGFIFNAMEPIDVKRDGQLSTKHRFFIWKMWCEQQGMRKLNRLVKAQANLTSSNCGWDEYGAANDPPFKEAADLVSRERTGNPMKWPSSKAGKVSK